MTFFELVKIVLDRLCPEYTKEFDCSDLNKKIAKEIRRLSSRYTRLGKQSGVSIDYRDPITRMAYLYMYVASHSDYLVQILGEFADRKGKIFEGKTIQISCLGSGPGSDILAVLKFLEERETETVKEVICRSYDKEDAWKHTRGKIFGSMEGRIKLVRYAQSWGLVDQESWTDRFGRTDLFTMSYFVSEVYSTDGEGLAAGFWERLFQRAKPGALFLYNDNSFEELDSYFDKQWQTAGMECLLSDERYMTPRVHEKKAALLDEYLDKFDKMNPKLKSKVTYRILRKPFARK